MINKKQFGIVILSAVLSLAMMAPSMPAKAAETTGDTGSSLDNLVMNKTVRLEDDGTYTINLEAYAKGQVKTETQTEVKPADIILVLDQSGSMKDEHINNIPSGYKEAGNLTIADILNGKYYVKVENKYYPVSVKQEVSEKTVWVDADDKTYEDSEISYTWHRKFDNAEFTAPTPFVTSSLKTFTRQGWIGYYYQNDIDSSEKSDRAGSAAEARTNFRNKYDTYNTDVDFRNDGGDDNKYYAAAVYIPVQKKNLTHYTLTYTDTAGTEQTIGSIDGTGKTTYTGQTLYTNGTTSGTRLEALQYAANQFIDEIHANAVENDVNHRIAVVGFGSDDYNGSHEDYYYSNSELFVGGTTYNYAAGGDDSTYNREGNLAANHYNEAFQDAATDAGYNNLKASVKALDGRGATYPNIGFEMANGIFQANTSDSQQRSKIVIFLTDGEPGDTKYTQSAANSAIQTAAITKNTYGARVYTVAVLDNDPDEDVSGFLKAMSSSDSYTLATSGQELDNFFETVTNDVETGVTTVGLSPDSYVLDELSNEFTFPEGYNVSQNVTIQTAAYTENDQFADPTDAGTAVKAEAVTENDSITGIKVSGFDFTSDDNVVLADKSSGHKLLITIRGVLAKDGAATNKDIATNTDQSGIWDRGDSGFDAMIKGFNQPTTKIGNKSFVLDYAKEADLDDIFNGDVKKLDNDNDKTFSQVNDDATTVSDTYGNAEVKNNTVAYTPKTMNWDGYDSFYALGTDTVNGDQTTRNMWSKVNVIPANNVYYEDDFITSESGTVGITYTGEWTVEGTSSGNKETPNTSHGGWKNEDLADDTTYSDGSAHKANTNDAKATFTFTGTGVDIYSRTNMQTGYVGMKVFRCDDDKEVLTQSLLIDNKAEGGEYYQIPTASFTGEYGTYKVELTVRSTADGRKDYYLDGIRVYNPLSYEQEQDSTVSEAYGDEVGAEFKEVRDLLLDLAQTEGKDTLSGAVFLAKDEGTNTTKVKDYLNDGPKNEVYLEQGQSILIGGVASDSVVSIGLKAPTGEATKAVVSAGVSEEQGAGSDSRKEYTISTASDLYYPIEASEDGYILIENDGPGLLAVTKLKTSGEAEFTSFVLSDAIAYANKFASLPIVDSTEQPSEPGQPSEPEQPAEPEQPSADGEGNVEIENPDENQDTEVEENNLLSWLGDLFGGIFGLF